MPTTTTVGPLLRDWREQRRRSQMDLALDVGVSPRHLSFVETGRARPSPELVLALAEGLEVPLRERNTLLLAAGFAPRYAETPLDAPQMQRALTAIQRILDAHDPYPGVVLDRTYNIVGANNGALALLEGLPAHLLEPVPNIVRVSLHPEGLASRTTNLREWAGYLLWQLDRIVATTGDRAVAALAEEVRTYPTTSDLPAHIPTDEPQILLAVRLATPGGELSLFTTLTTFGTPRDITLDELVIELFYPADEATERLLHGG
ncbi:MAG: helix-turn-helix transcriptional regulator [Euzebyales bacterium]|jgi:transcriptional regulator with XRE-family HTH domain|nr:helix-turn-helix transcriptional regulator [Euzebyales bacterium]